VIKVLGIETSCDETSVAIVDSNRNILALNTLSKLDEHRFFGGVVPEIAARNHMLYLKGLVEKSVHDADINLNDIDGIAATAGPGLIGGVLVGVMVAKALSSALKKPFIAVNHLEGHALTIRLTDNISFPYLLLLVSGGHCQLLTVEGLGKYKKLGATLDDAVGEAFDKVGKMLGLSYPAGPLVEALAKKGDGKKYELPKPLLHEKNCNFSFSGLKTAVKRLIDANTPLNEQMKADIAASFQETIAEVIVKKVANAMELYEEHYPTSRQLVVAGGVAANLFIRDRLNQLAVKKGYKLFAPRIDLCTDNAAMIAQVGIEYLRAGTVSSLTFEPRSRWPLN
jgi:N6-L-threonylcarbamoyladenine synthase